MMGRHIHVVQQNMRRDEMARLLASAANKFGIKTASANSSNIFIAENADGEQFTVTIARKQQQDREIR